MWSEEVGVQYVRRDYLYVPARKATAPSHNSPLVPSLIEGLRVVQGLRVVPVFLYRYSMKNSLKEARSPGTTEGGGSD
jgi:hypothetical protein